MTGCLWSSRNPAENKMTFWAGPGRVSPCEHPGGRRGGRAARGQQRTLGGWRTPGWPPYLCLPSSEGRLELLEARPGRPRSWRDPSGPQRMLTWCWPRSDSALADPGEAGLARGRRGETAEVLQQSQSSSGRRSEICQPPRHRKPSVLAV